MGYIIGPIIEERSLLGFNNSDIVLLFFIDLFIVFGFLVLVIKTKKEFYLRSDPGQRLKMSILVVCFALFFLFSTITAFRELSRQYGAAEGYKAGYEQGICDNDEGRAFNLKQESIPKGYRFGSSKWKGYMTYWPTGYKDGYMKKKE